MSEAPLGRREIEAGIRRLAPFHHAVELPHGLTSHDPERSRREIEQVRLESLWRYVRPLLEEHLGPSLEGRRVLDVGCNCGGFALEAAKLGADEVTGIDVVEHYLEQARFLARATGCSDTTFLQMNVEDLDPAQTGVFDVTFCFDVLWHFENPVLSLRRMAGVTRELLVVETRLTDRGDEGEPVWVMAFLPETTEDALDLSTSLWRTRRICEFHPNETAVVELLTFLGFDAVEPVELTPEDRDHRFPDGTKTGLFAACRSAE